MKHRKLRIAWSVAWGLVAVLLIALWVRSYWRYENVTFRSSAIQIDLRSGRGMGLYEVHDPSARYAYAGWYLTHPVIEGGLYYGKRQFEILYYLGEHPRFMYFRPTLCVVPYWLMVPVATLMAALAWVPYLTFRFSLRTLLIATTLAAIGLGALVYNLDK